MTARLRRCVRRGDGHGQRDDGRIFLLVAGLFALLALLIMGGVDVTSVQLARMHTMDVADAAAAHAADAVDLGSIYRDGLGGDLRLSDSGVRRDAGASLAGQRRPAHIARWWLAPGTGTPDGRTAVVRVTADVQPPILGGLLSFVGRDVAVTAESHARAELQSP